MKSALIASMIAGLSFTASAGALAKNDPPKQSDMKAPAREGAERIMRHARETRAKKGCAEAAPTFRVVAAMGHGLEPAQHELAECLLQLEGASPVETALFRKEAIFWLERAAYAGNARAQRKLATLQGAPNNEFSDNVAALGWALVYGKNGDADLYGYKSLPPTFVPGLQRSVSEEELASAHAFAENFTPIHLETYESPPHLKSQNEDRGPEAKGSKPQDRKGRRRR